MRNLRVKTRFNITVGVMTVVGGGKLYEVIMIVILISKDNSN